VFGDDFLGIGKLGIGDWPDGEWINMLKEE
jgi:hypothetical protein